MTTQELARAGAFLRAARLLARGKSNMEILASLRREFFYGTNDQFQAIIDMAKIASLAAARLEQLEPGDALDPADIPNLGEL
jgi:hypothetical protein